MDVTGDFLSGVDDSVFLDVLGVVEGNCVGGFWLIGGFVYRTLASVWYGVARPVVDLDFLVERPVDVFDLPEGWVVKKNRYGNPKLVSGGLVVDYVPLNNVYSILKRGVEPSIESFLSGVPLNVQSIAYDCVQRKVIGNVGIKALVDRVVCVNDLGFAEYAARMKGLSVNDFIEGKARELGFTPVFP